VNFSSAGLPGPGELVAEIANEFLLWRNRIMLDNRSSELMYFTLKYVQVKSRYRFRNAGGFRYIALSAAKGLFRAG
jgi:hypothetical protein